MIPVERPTVPNAETTSNNSCIKLYSGSSTHIKNVATHTTVPESIVIINAFEIFCSDIFLWNACTVPFVHVPLIFLEHDKNVLCLDTSTGGSRRGTNKHQDTQYKQAGIRKLPNRIGGKSGGSRRNALEERPQPCYILCQFKCQCSDNKQNQTGNDHHLGVQSKLLETLLFSYIQNNKKSQSAKNDQCTCGQIQKDIILIRRQVSKSSQNVKPRVIKGCNRMENTNSDRMHGTVIPAENQKA